MNLFTLYERTLLLTMALLVMGAGNTVWAQKPIRLEDLLNVKGVYYTPTTNTLYTGNVYYGVDDVVSIKNGKLDGDLKNYDYDEGDGGGLSTVIYYRDGKMHQIWMNTYDEGWKLFDGNEKPATVNNTGYTSENGVLFNKNKTVLVSARGIQGAYVIPNSVTSIESDAFSVGCGMTSLVIPNSVTSIKDGTFSNCSSLESVTIPSGLTSLKGFNFSENSNLIAVEVAPDNPRYASEDGVLFNKNKTTLIGYPSGKQDKSYKIPNGVVSIGKKAFYGCNELKSVTIPNSVTTIEDGTFGDLTSIIVLSAVPPKLSEPINAKCLYVPLGSVDVYRNADHWKDVKCINAIMAFDTLDDGAQKWVIEKRGGYVTAVFSNGTLAISGTGDMEDYTYHTAPPWKDIKDSITAVVIRDGVTSIGNGAFSSHKNLVTITIPGGVTKIERGMFSGCTSLKNIDVSNDNPKYRSVDGVLFSKAKDTLFMYPPAKEGTYTVPNGTIIIMDKAFDESTGLTAVTIPNGTTSIGNNAFKECKNLKSITIPNSVKVIETNAFSGCGSLGTMNIAANNPVYIIANSVLYDKNRKVVMFGVVGKAVLSLPDGVTAIEDGAFSANTSLKSITIPNSVASIGKFAFSGCRNLTSITIKNQKPPTVGPYTFFLLTAVACTLYVPQGSIYVTTPVWNGFKHIGYMDSNGKVVQIVSSSATSFAVEQTIDQYKKQLADCGTQKSDQCAMAMYMLGTTYYQQASANAAAIGSTKPDFSMAIQIYQQFLSEYPSSPYLASVKQMLTQIEIMSLPPEQQQAARERAVREQQAAQERAVREQQAAQERAVREQQATQERAAKEQQIAREQQAAWEQDMRQQVDQWKKQLANCGVQKNGQCEQAIYMLGTFYYKVAVRRGGEKNYLLATQMLQRLLNEYPTSTYSLDAKEMLTQIDAK